MMILFAILVSQHVATANGGAVLLALILLNNTIYLVFLMLFLGYGLVAFPLSLWQRGNLLGELKRSEHKAAARYTYLGDANIVMGKAVADVMKTNEAAQRQLSEYSDLLLSNAMKTLVSGEILSYIMYLLLLLLLPLLFSIFKFKYKFQFSFYYFIL